jgi:chromatin remodeling complex protein RSC6
MVSMILNQQRKKIMSSQTTQKAVKTTTKPKSKSATKNVVTEHEQDTTTERVTRPTPTTTEEPAGEEQSSSEEVDRGSQQKKKVDLLELEKSIEGLLKEKTDSRLTLKSEIDILKNLRKDFKSVSRELDRYRNRRVQRGNQVGGAVNRKPSGFAALEATDLSDKLCDFLGIEHGSKLSHTTVAQRIRDYIKTNELQRKDNGRFIIVDEKLEALFGNAAERTRTMQRRKEEKPSLKSPINSDLQYFNIQSHLKYHFISKKSNDAATLREGSPLQASV